MKSDKDKIRDAGEVQSDHSLKAIQDLGDSIASSFEVLESEGKKQSTATDEQIKTVTDSVEEVKTEMHAGFKVQGDRINTMDRRAMAIYGSGRDVESCCLAALGPEERKDISIIGKTIPSSKRNNTNFALLSNDVGSTLVAHWLWASLKLQKRKYGSKQEETALFEQMDRYEKALMEAFHYEKAAAFTTGSDTLGGHWMPDPVAAEMYRLILDNSVVGPLARHVPMTTKTLDLPIEGSSALTVGWGTENSDVGDSVPSSNALDKVVLTANRLEGFAASSWEAIQDSPVSILLWVRDKLTELMGREIDQEALEGVGSPFTGIVGATGVNQIASATNGDLITYAKVVDTVFKAAERATREDSRFFISPGLAGKLIGLVDSQGMPIVQFGNVPGAFARTILGFPLEIHSVVSSARTWGTGTTLSHLYFGPPSAIVIGDRVGMAWDTTDVAGDAFRKYQLHMRLITRLAIATAVPKAWTRTLNLQTT